MRSTIIQNLMVRFDAYSQLGVIVRNMLLLVVVMTVQTSMAESMVTEDEVYAFMEQYEAALHSENFSNVEPLIHPDAIFRFNDGDYSGIDAIKGAFDKTWSLKIEENRYYLSDAQVLHRDVNSATVLFKWHWSGISKEHGSFHIVGRGTSGIVRAEGKFRVMFEHLSR